MPIIVTGTEELTVFDHAHEDINLFGWAGLLAEEKHEVKKNILCSHTIAVTMNNV